MRMLRRTLVILVSALFLFSAAGKGATKPKGVLIFVVHPITSSKILPFTPIFSIPGTISNEIKMAACRGEYEPASFVLRSSSEIANLTIKPSELKGESGNIPVENIDIKVVKCWYQAGTAWVGIDQNKDKRVLVPELLLNDDLLVKVDYKEEKNYLKLRFPGGDKYIWTSNPEGTTRKLPVKSKHPTVEEFPVKDSPALLPVNVPAGTNKQFWCTVKVPEDAKAGVYSGKISLSTPKGSIGSLTLKLKVLPFELSAPYYTSSIYYGGVGPCNGTISSGHKSKEQLKAELKNMFAHGVTNPICYSYANEYLKIRQEIVGDQPLYYCCWAWNTNILSKAVKSGDLEPLKDRAKEIIEIAKSFGIPEVYFYGLDEARGEELTSQRPAWEAVHEAGGKIFVAGYAGSNFELMGDIQDLLICGFYPSKKEADKWHSAGHKIWCYANPQSGPENPELFRRNYGLLLWKNDYDGAATFCYQMNAGNIWNDFDHEYYRDHNFTYPTVNGVIDTIAWEGYREGVDDVRYMTTLLKEIEKCKKSKSKKMRENAAAAEKYLETLDVESRDLDTIRLELISYILRLQ